MTDRRAHAEQDEELREALATVASEATRLGRTLTRTEWPEPLRDVVVEQGDVPVERAIAEKMISAVARELSDGWELWAFTSLLGEEGGLRGSSRVRDGKRREAWTLGGYPAQASKEGLALDLARAAARQALVHMGCDRREV